MEIKVVAIIVTSPNHHQNKDKILDQRKDESKNKIPKDRRP